MKFDCHVDLSFLLEHGDREQMVHVRDSEGRTPVFSCLSAPKHYAECLTLLLEHGFDPAEVTTSR